MKSHRYGKNKQFILDTAYSLFNEKGYKKTTMRDIAGRSGGSLGSITYYFKKKADIAKALYLEFSKNFYTQIRRIYSKLDLNTIEADTVYLCTSVLVEVSNPKLIRFMFDVSQEGLLTDIMKDTIFMQFARKNEYLKLNKDNESLMVESLFYIGMYQQLVVGIKSGLIHDVDKAIYIFNVQHLQQLGFSNTEINAILKTVLPICHAIKVEEEDIFDITLQYPYF
ncbi:TetR/AcrR family transcriptional regulator [Alkalibacter rhizosphaerae]|uniref:TetR/AcrR family transcriptional regulator n=1 Tax=Alkalibacter rhizosphaerae TaxID=2815577 RepID=A0A974XJA0_9FIRM|nr:TetR/AcrR family transcriptional regulator [Alkalibacter rhizosphaerae]QSX09423.1 TetR/AcrR family transcriptional regulator [Alkalibacter rhizosphaerae]